MKWLVQVSEYQDAITVELLSDQDGVVTARVDGELIDLHVSEFAPGRLLVNGGNEVTVVEHRGCNGDFELIDWRGAARVKVLDERDTWIASGPSGDAARTITVAMPGRVVKVNVAQGDPVSKGDCLCVIEAMKMENDICAPRDGVVSAVHITEGSAVDAAQPLIELD
jgi:acetyl/propionyl-CoA carboxylase alpha subunit